MHAGKNYTLKQVFHYTKREIVTFIIIAFIPTFLYMVLGFKWMTIPWFPIALVGTAVAFLIGFKNNASYDRMWEARKIYGGIVNTSRIWGMMVRDYVTSRLADSAVSEDDVKAVHTQMIYRHIAWMTALRHQLRVPKVWERHNNVSVKEFMKHFKIQEHEYSLEEELALVLTDKDLHYVLSKSNRATQLIAMQSNELKILMDAGLIEDFRHMELENVLKELLVFQGKAERIKNFPYPRQFATINRIFVWLFIILIPFGMFKEFDKLGEYGAWLAIPFTTLIAWVFHTMDKIGESTENPFGSNANDIPITTISRGIEIDLREMLDEKDIPEAIAVENFVSL